MRRRIHASAQRAVPLLKTDEEEDTCICTACCTVVEDG